MIGLCTRCKKKLGSNVITNGILCDSCYEKFENEINTEILKDMDTDDFDTATKERNEPGLPWLDPDDLSEEDIY
jgi:hypothetical protein